MTKKELKNLFCEAVELISDLVFEAEDHSDNYYSSNLICEALDFLKEREADGTIKC